MSLSQNFLTQFQTKMDALTNERSRVQKTIQDRQQFTNELKTKLGQIYQRLQFLANLINQLKTKATTLETQVTSNNVDIIAKQQEIDNLKKQMLSDTNLKGVSQSRINVLEGQIKKYEEQIKTLNDQSEALRKELSSKGDQQKTHADAINELTRKSKEEKDTLVLELNNTKARVAQLEQNQITNQGQSNNLQGQITQLQTENKELINKLTLAIKAITDATLDLKNLMDTVPNAQTKQEVDQLLSQITQQIETSISSLQNTSQSPSAPNSGFFSNILSRSNKPAANPLTTGNFVTPGSRNAIVTPVSPSSQNLGYGARNAPYSSIDLFNQASPIFGQPPNLANRGISPGINPSNSSGQGLNDTTQVKLYEGDPNPMVLGRLKDKMKEKINSPLLGQFSAKYRRALEAIDNAKDANEIPGILASNRITYRNGELRGGIKSKKYRKQKGGFTYKKKSRRSSITSNSRYRKSSRTNRRSSR